VLSIRTTRYRSVTLLYSSVLRLSKIAGMVEVPAWFYEGSRSKLVAARATTIAHWIGKASETGIRACKLIQLGTLRRSIGTPGDVGLVKKKQTAKKNRDASERVERSKKVVLAATYELMTEVGLSGMSIDEVARRSGVAKTTIYRHWPSRSSLLLEACNQLSAKLQAPDSGSLKGDLEILASAIVKILHSPRSTVLPSVIDAGERDEELAQLQSREFCEVQDAFRVAIDQGKHRGELPSRENAQELIAAILGPLFFRRWFSREGLDETVARRVVARALRTAD
jgi:AcrR family transcriptional regulator